jgi:hypothetical protein
MRRKDKEITDRSLVENILKNEKICRIAFFDETYPYMIPLCYGYEDGAIYFHGFREGHKIDCIRKNPHVCFEIDADTAVLEDPDPCEWTVRYRSIVGFGRATLLEGPEEKRHGLDVIVKQFAGRTLSFPDEAMGKVAVVRIDIDSMTGRKNGFENS